MAVVEVHPVPIDGPWIEGCVLDHHVIYIGKAAHICAAASGGPRFHASMSADERRAMK